MLIMGKIKDFFRRFKQNNQNIIDRRLLAPGRETSSNELATSLGMSFLSRRYKEYHRVDITRYVNTTTADQLLNILIDSNPDVSQALYSFLRMCNSGFIYKVLKVNGTPFKEAQDTMDEWMRKLQYQQTNQGFKEDRSLNSFINKMHLSFFVKGAASSEVVVNDKLEPAYMVPVDPHTVWFKGDESGELIPYQLQVAPTTEQRKKGVWEGNYKKIDIPSFFYQPLDARIDDVYGVCPILPALQTIFFQIQVLQDLQAVVHKAGYPRLDLKLLEEILIKNAPPMIKNDAKKLAEWLNQRKADIETEYKSIKPEDAMIHFDSVEAKYLETQRGMGTYDARALMEVVDAQVIASLKSLSILMGRYRGRTETYASAEVQLYIKGIEAIQKLSAQLMNRILTFCLNLFGYQGYVEFEYLPIELRSKTELAQWNAVRIRNHLMFVALGMQSFDEACIELTGHKPSGKVNDDLDLILALLNVEYPAIAVERPSSTERREEDNHNFRTADELLDKINGKR